MLLALAAVVQLVLGVAAIAGAAGLRSAVEEIQSNPDFGRLYFSLGVWGCMFGVAALGQAAGARSAWRGAAHGRLYALAAAFIGLAVSFFGLAIFRVGSLVAIALLLIAIFMLAYHSTGDAD